MYRINLLLFFTAIGFGLTACDQNPNSPEGISTKPSITQKNESDAKPALPIPVHTKAGLNKTQIATAASYTNAATTSEVVNEKDYYLQIDAISFFVPCCDYPSDYTFTGYAHLVVTPSGQMHVNINGSDFEAMDVYSNYRIKGTGKYIDNSGDGGNSGRGKAKVKIKFTDDNGCVFYFNLYFHFEEGEPQVYKAEVTCEE